MNTPSSAGSERLYLVSSEMTMKEKSIWSMAMICFLAKFCLAPVKNDWVKKKPESQKFGGAPSSTHFYMNLSLSRLPLLHEFESFKTIKHPWCKRFQGWVSSLGPNTWNNIVEYTVVDFFKFNRQWNFSSNCLADIHKWSSNNVDKLVVSQKFLLEHSVHRVFILDGMFLGASFHVVFFWELVKDVICEISNDIIHALSISSTGSGCFL